MKILSIKYKNYRCFNDLSLDFKTKPGKNIFMVVAPNGGGKTEMLFSFQWVLYGFDFSLLKQKQDTPYSLNSSLHQALERGRAGDSRTCSVELEFEVDGIVYNVLRSEKFTKKFKGDDVWSETSVSLSNTDPNGVRSLPIDDPEIVEARLSKIIPKKILQGIIFDGERMKELSQVTDESREAVEGVIRQITNEELFERCKTELGAILKENSRAIKSVGRKAGGNDEVAEIENEIQETLSSIESKTDEQDIKKFQVREIEARLKEIHRALSESKETKALEERRTELNSNLDTEIDELADLYDTLRDDLDNGYLLISDEILDDVDQLIKEYDIPSGLTVTAVRNILSRPTCICGEPWTDEHRKKLSDLIEQLPPDNLNSTLGEMVSHAREDKNDLKKLLKRTFDQIRTHEKDINKLKQEIADISTRISEGAPEQIKQLEEENIKKTKELGILEERINLLDEELPILKRKLIQLRKDRDESGKSSNTLKLLTKRETFITKCLNALKALDEYNKMVSLQEINDRINDSYKQLSEDYSNGRRLYIVQYDKRSKYRMATYIEKKFNDIYKEDPAAIAVLRSEPGILDPVAALKEMAIRKVLEPNSTGQAKINTLAFAKSILDYSRAERDEDSTEISRSYPFLIDSPFTELSDGNLRQSAACLHTFAEQVILMISKESLSGVQDLILPHVGGKATFAKKNNDASSTLEN